MRKLQRECSAELERADNDESTWAEVVTIGLGQMVGRLPTTSKCTTLVVVVLSNAVSSTNLVFLFRLHPTGISRGVSSVIAQLASRASKRRRCTCQIDISREEFHAELMKELRVTTSQPPFGKLPVVNYIVEYIVNLYLASKTRK